MIIGVLTFPKLSTIKCALNKCVVSVAIDALYLLGVVGFIGADSAQSLAIICDLISENRPSCHKWDFKKY